MQVLRATVCESAELGDGQPHIHNAFTELQVKDRLPATASFHVVFQFALSADERGVMFPARLSLRNPDGSVPMAYAPMIGEDPTLANQGPGDLTYIASFASHDFMVPGRYTCELTLEAPNGEECIASASILVRL